MKIKDILFQYLLGMMLVIMIVNLVRNIDENSLFSIFVSTLTIPFIGVSSMMMSNYINVKTGQFLSEFFNGFPLIIGVALSGLTIRLFFPQLVF